MSPSIDSLLEQCILALESGDQARVDELIAAYPEHAFGLRERLAELASLGILQPPRAAPAIPERLGEFRLLRQIGRGGMGVVYLAEQESLRRQVALKLVHPEHLFFDDAHERFRRETLAVARLQHPGIVPILTCGDAGGIPYYAMELVHGASLAEVLQELGGTAPMALDGPALCSSLHRAMAKKHDVLPVHDAPVFHGTWTNVVCRLVLGAATALSHAHEHGVLHRDLKPSNLLLAADGNVRLIDFGLATAEGDQRITRSGSTLGSLPYMAPEQVRGETNRIDARTDVYQLGVALYELLTLWLPHGDGRRDTRERILAGNAAPPSRLNPQVHPDIDAVCSCAMDPDPARRYASARAFADDLRAFLEQRHVRARRPSPWLRLQRWVRRRPFAAAGALIGFVLLVPAPLLFALQQQAANLTIAAARDDADRERKKAVDNLAEADHQRELALRNLDHAIASVQQMLVRTAEARLGDVPRTARLRRQLLEDAVQFYERLAASVPSDAEPRLLAARAVSQLSLGELQISLGSLDVALPGLQATLAELERLAPQRREGRPDPACCGCSGAATACWRRCTAGAAKPRRRRGPSSSAARPTTRSRGSNRRSTTCWPRAAPSSCSPRPPAGPATQRRRWRRSMGSSSGCRMRRRWRCCRRASACSCVVRSPTTVVWCRPAAAASKPPATRSPRVCRCSRSCRSTATTSCANCAPACRNASAWPCTSAATSPPRRRCSTRSMRRLRTPGRRRTGAAVVALPVRPRARHARREPAPARR